MKEEYVFRISRRDKDHPLAETMIVEFGTDAKHPDAFADALQNLVHLLKIHTTPEKVKRFMMTNAFLSNLARRVS